MTIAKYLEGFTPVSLHYSLPSKCLKICTSPCNENTCSFYFYSLYLLQGPTFNKRWAVWLLMSVLSFHFPISLILLALNDKWDCSALPCMRFSPFCTQILKKEKREIMKKEESWVCGRDLLWPGRDAGGAHMSFSPDEHRPDFHVWFTWIYSKMCRRLCIIRPFLFFAVGVQGNKF